MGRTSRTLVLAALSRLTLSILSDFAEDVEGDELGVHVGKEMEVGMMAACECQEDE